MKTIFIITFTSLILSTFAAVAQAKVPTTMTYSGTQHLEATPRSTEGATTERRLSWQR